MFILQKIYRKFETIIFSKICSHFQKMSFIKLVHNFKKYSRFQNFHGSRNLAMLQTLFRNFKKYSCFQNLFPISEKYSFLKNACDFNIFGIIICWTIMVWTNKGKKLDCIGVLIIKNSKAWKIHNIRVNCNVFDYIIL